MNFVYHIIRSSDIFGQPISLNLKRKQINSLIITSRSYKSIFGGCVSLMTIGFFLLIFQREAFSIMDYEQYNIQIQNHISSDPPEESFINKQFLFALKIKDQQLSGPQYFKIKLLQKKKLNSQNQSLSTEIDLEQCTINHFSTAEQQLAFNKYKIGDYLCSKPNQQFTLEGGFNSDSFQYLKFTIQKCNDASCVDQSEIDSYLQKNGLFQMEIAIFNFIIDIENPSPIIPYFYQEYFNFVPYLMYPSTNIFVSKEIIIENRSLLPLLSNQNENIVYLVKVKVLIMEIQEENVVERVIVQNEMTSENSTTYGEFYIRMHYNIVEYNKGYRKIDEFLAYMGGFLKIALLIIGKSIQFVI